MVKAIAAGWGLLACAVSGLASAQPSDNWRDSSAPPAAIRAAPAVPSVTVEPQPRELAPPSVKPEPAWYGGQVLLADAVSLGVLGTGLGLAMASNASSDTHVAEGLLLGGTVGYVLAPIAIHSLHERPGMAVASASLRIFTPPLIGFLALVSADCGHSSYKECTSGVALGVGTGMVLASILDAVFLAHEAPVESPASSRFGVTPIFSADGTRGELRAFGTF